MQLRTHERIWITQLIDAHKRDSLAPEPGRVINYDDLVRRITPSPESVMREALESIYDAPDGVLPNPREVAGAALTIARRIHDATAHRADGEAV